MKFGRVGVFCKGGWILSTMSWFEWVQTGKFLRRFDGQLGVWSEFKGLDSSFFR